MARIFFIAQHTLFKWQDENKVEFEGSVMRVTSTARSFKLTDAFRFIKVETGDKDTSGLLGKVKTEYQLERMGAERYCDSVLVGDTAYKVEEGFIANALLSPELSKEMGISELPSQSKANNVPDKKEETKDELSDEKLLTKFLLDNL
jgi:hypothetical protein